MKKQPIIFFSVIILIMIALFIYMDFDKNGKKEAYLNNFQQTFHENYNVTYNNFRTLSQTVYNIISHNQQIIELYEKLNNTTSNMQKNELRENLYTKLNPLYIQWAQIGINQLHFQTKDNVSFLRFHQLNKFGDDLSHVRDSIAYVNKTHLPIEGFEMGKVQHGFRFVYPLINENNTHLGSIEVSISSERFRQNLKDSFDENVKFIINKNIVQEKAWDDAINNFYEPTQLSNEYYRFKDNDSFKIDLDESVLKSIRVEFTTQKPFTLAYKTDKYHVISFLPLKDLQTKKVIAYFVNHSDAKYLDELEFNYFILYILLIIMILGVSYYLYRDTKHKSNLSQSFETIQQQKEELAHSLHELEKQNLQISKNMQDNRDKDKLIALQSKQASLGEMIGNIAHQWRQPLSAISSTASGLYMQNDLGILDNDDLSKSLQNIIVKTKYLSQTIDDFRNFINGTNEKTDFTIDEVITQSLNVIDSSIEKNNIKVIKNIDSSIMLHNYKNELIQVIINIVNNAKDALEENNNDINHRLVLIDVNKNETHAIITIKDNGGGIPKNILDKIFEPYFTTKHQSQGTGLGLYMTYDIVVNNMHGTIEVENISFSYDNLDFTGAQFTIQLDLKEKEE